MPNATAWLIFDQKCWDKFGIFGIPPGGEVPDYLQRADTLAELASKIGVDEVRLLRTVDRTSPLRSSSRCRTRSMSGQRRRHPRTGA
jgi:3-oxosteroid 1-dehydrogenase